MGQYLFGISIPFYWLTILVVSLYCLAVSGIALCISGVVKTEQQLNVTGSFFAVVTSMILGGVPEKGDVILLKPDEPVPDGTPVA